MLDSLAATLRERHEQAVIANAELIRDWPESDERTDYALRYIREAMNDATLGQISRDVESRVFSVLSFAMPDDAPVNGDQPPDDFRLG